MGKIKQFFLNRLDERSTWRAIVALLTIGGITLTDVQMEAIVVAGVAVGALLEALLPDPSGRIYEPRATTDADRLSDTERLPPVSEGHVDEQWPARSQSGAEDSRSKWLG